MFSQHKQFQLNTTVLMITRPLRQWWTGGNQKLLLGAQDKLIRNLVAARGTRIETNDGIINGIEFSGNPSSDETLVIAHGFGSGLGFYFRNVDLLLKSNKYHRIVLFDWIGMGGSKRPSCHAAPIRGWSEFSTSWCNSRFSAEQAVRFFIDPLQSFLDENEINNITLVGHSLGGYLGAKYTLQYPGRIQKLVLASPVGFPKKPLNAIPQTELSTGLRIVDALWSSNITPQQLVRLMGSTRGRQNVRRALKGRISHLSKSEIDFLAEYLYQITVADPSGEYAMNSLLEPVVSTNTMGVFAREPLHNEMINIDSSIMVKILFGDQDWMRAQPNEQSVRQVINTLQSTRSNSTASVHIIPNAGHHLYLDNPQSFTQHILS